MTEKALKWLYDQAARFGDLGDSVEVYAFVQHVFRVSGRECPDREEWRRAVDCYAEADPWAETAGEGGQQKAASEDGASVNGWYGDGRKDIFVACGDQERISILMVQDQRPVGTVYLPPVQVRRLVRQLMSWEAARVPAMFEAFGQALRDFGESYEIAEEEARLTDAQSTTEGGSAARSDCLRGLSCAG